MEAIAAQEREAFIGVTAALAAAISLLERTQSAMKAAPSDKMFTTMLADYRKALEAGRAALGQTRWEKAKTYTYMGDFAALDRKATALMAEYEFYARSIGCEVIHDEIIASPAQMEQLTQWLREHTL
jgi:hypothetical protein